jgi:hypothetical protein
VEWGWLKGSLLGVCLLGAKVSLAVRMFMRMMWGGMLGMVRIGDEYNGMSHAFN